LQRAADAAIPAPPTIITGKEKVAVVESGMTPTKPVVTSSK
jgi:hypothetical protein